MEFNISNTKVRATDLVLARDPSQKPVKAQSLADIYDRAKRMFFILDTSGSMNCRVGSKNEVKKFLWPPEKLTEIKDAVRKAAAELDAARAAAGPMADLLVAPETHQLAGMLSAVDDDERLKQLVIDKDLIVAFNLAVDWERHDETAPTRLELLKTLGVREMRKRFEKYPDALVSLIWFGTDAVLADTGKDSWEVAIRDTERKYDTQCGGGTDILKALALALDVIAKQPAPLNHLVLVSDGEDYVADRTLPTWLSTLKAARITLDFIQIGSCVQENIKKVAEETGGSFTLVQTAEEMESKFVEAAQRLCLPPAA